jgi:hypothetical protein
MNGIAVFVSRVSSEESCELHRVFIATNPFIKLILHRMAPC